VRLDLEKAQKEDPTVFEYDEVYEDMKKSREPSFGHKKEEEKKKPKYITNLLKTAETRKREHERRSEKKIQKEREEEGQEFKDKEAFVTSAYKEKLLEMEEAEEREKREARVEELLDVKKQKDLSGFYRHLLKQTVGEEKVGDSVRDFASSSARTGSEDHQESGGLSTETQFQARSGKRTQKNIRTRKESSSESEDEIGSNAPESGHHNPGEKADGNKAGKETKLDHVHIQENPNDEAKKSRENVFSGSVESAQPSSGNKAGTNEEMPPKIKEEPDASAPEIGPEKPQPEEPEIPKVPKVRIDRKTLLLEKFTKRTVGQVYDEAKQRYLERKQARALFRNSAPAVK
jgi:coiled-coil domain-containing protein 55